MDWFHSKFAKQIPNGALSRMVFCEILENNSEFVDNLFYILDSDHSNCLFIQEFLGALFKLNGHYNKTDRLFHIFMQKAGSSGNLVIEDFYSICKDKKFAECLFDVFDYNTNGRLKVSEFIIYLDKIASTSTGDKWYSWAEKWFTRVASENGCITKQEFLKHLNLTKSFFGERLFAVADEDKSGNVDASELMKLIQVLTQGSQTERLLLLFDMFDVDGSKSISRDEMLSVMQSCLVDSQIINRLELSEMLTDFLFNGMDIDRSGTVSFTEFEEFLGNYPQIAESLTINLPGCLKPKLKKNKTERGSKFLKLWKSTLNNKPLVVYWMIYFTVNVILFTSAALKYLNNNNAFVVVARGAGQCLNFNSAYIVVLMYRHFWGLVRSTRLRKVLPLDQSIELHKVAGYAIAFFSLLHTAMHIGNFAVLSNETSISLPRYLFSLNLGIGWVEGSACITGWVDIFILGIIVLLSLPLIRRRGYFQVFYWSHWIFIVWWGVLVVHAPSFWKWLAGPGVLYIMEKLYQQFKERSNVRILSVRRVGKQVSQLLIQRPKKFQFQAGSYILIKIKEISSAEWHPFTISSAPEQTEYISLHVQAIGGWTKRLYTMGLQWKNERIEQKLKCAEEVYINKTCEPVILLNITPLNKNQEKMTQTQIDAESNLQAKFPLVYIDGPYGSPTTNVHHIEHAILIAAGIGVTPFSSILQSLQLKFNKWCGSRSPPMAWRSMGYDLTQVTQKVDFIWVTRTLDAMDWFLVLLKQLEDSQSHLDLDARFMDINLHATSFLALSDMRAVALQVALQLCYQQECRDPLSGLKTRILPGRPNWEKLFHNIISKSKWKITVFYCGPPQLKQILQKFCLQFKLDFRSENF